jgi:hypothetical protein
LFQMETKTKSLPKNLTERARRARGIKIDIKIN